MKIPSVGAELFRADGRTDGQTDMTMLIVAFRNLANAPKVLTIHVQNVNIENRKAAREECVCVCVCVCVYIYIYIYIYRTTVSAVYRGPKKIGKLKQ